MARPSQGQALSASPPKKVVRAPDKTRRALVDAGVSLFSELGFDATSVRDLVETAQVTKGAFYHHFLSKEDLLREIHDEFTDYQLDLLRVARDTDASPEEMFRILLADVFLKPIERYRHHMKIFMQERRHLKDPAFGEVFQKRKEFEDTVVDVLDRRVQQGDYRDLGSTRVLALALIGMSAWAMNWLDGSPSIDEVSQVFFELTYRGLKPPDTT